MSEKQENQVQQDQKASDFDAMNFDDFDDRNSSDFEEEAMEEEVDEELENRVDHESPPEANKSTTGLLKEETPNSGREEGAEAMPLTEEEMYLQGMEDADMPEGFGAGLTEEELALLASSPEGVEMLLAQHELDYDDSIKEIEKMVDNLIITYDQEMKKLTLIEIEDSETQESAAVEKPETEKGVTQSKKETIIHENEIFKFIYEINLEAYIYFQQGDLCYSFYCLRKAELVLNKLKNSQIQKQLTDEFLLVKNNISFLYWKMNQSERSIEILNETLEIISKRRKTTIDKNKLQLIRQDFFNAKCEKIKYKKLKARLNMALCILHSEQLKHDEALKFANKALKTITSLIYDSQMFCYHLLIKSHKQQNLQKKKADRERRRASNKQSKNSVISNSGKKSTKNSAPETEEASKSNTETTQPHTVEENESMIKEEDREYLEVVLALIKDVLERIRDLELEKPEKNHTIDLLKKLMEQVSNVPGKKKNFLSHSNHPASLKSSINFRKNQNKKPTLVNDGPSQSVTPTLESAQKLAQSTPVPSLGPIVPPNKINIAKVYETYYPGHYLSNSTILNIAQLQFLTPDSILFAQTTIEEEVCPEIVLEKIGLLIICFYAISTEYRFKEKITEIASVVEKDAPDEEKKKPPAVVGNEGIGGVVQARRFGAKKSSLDKKKTNKPSKKKITNEVPKSECYLGRAVELSYLYMNHEMPFVLQIFNVFKRFQSASATIIPENEPLNERCIYLRPLPGGCDSDIIIPFIRRSITKGWLNMQKAKKETKRQKVGGSMERKVRSRKRDLSQRRTDHSWSKSRGGKRSTSQNKMRNTHHMSKTSANRFGFPGMNRNAAKKANISNKQIVFPNMGEVSTSQNFKNGKEFVPKTRYIPYRIKNKKNNNPKMKPFSKHNASNTSENSNPSRKSRNRNGRRREKKIGRSSKEKISSGKGRSKDLNKLNGILEVNGVPQMGRTRNSHPHSRNEIDNNQLQLHIGNVNTFNIYVNNAPGQGPKGGHNPNLQNMTLQAPKIEEFFKEKPSLEELTLSMHNLRGSMGKNHSLNKYKFAPDTRKSDAYTQNIYTQPLSNYHKPVRKSNKRKHNDYKKFKIGRHRPRERYPHAHSKIKRNNLIMPKLQDSGAHSSKLNSKYSMNKTLGAFGTGSKHSGLAKYESIPQKYEKGVKREAKSGSNFWSNPIAYKGGNKNSSPRQSRTRGHKFEGGRKKLEKLVTQKSFNLKYRNKG